MKNTEQILIEKLLEAKFEIKADSIYGIFKWGSNLYETTNEKSDLDYVIIIDNFAHIWKGYSTEKHFQYESDDLDLHIISHSHYLSLLEKCDIMALECYFQNNAIKKYTLENNFDFNLINLRKSISSISSNSYVKAKKKLSLTEDIEHNRYIALKSLFHSLRITDLGIDLALSIIDYKANPNRPLVINDFTSHGVSFSSIERQFIECQYDWEVIHKLYKPVLNGYASEFRKLAPKE
jgi:hypothetical protein